MEPQVEHLIIEIRDHLGIISFNRVKQHNAFDDQLLTSLLHALKQLEKDPQVRVIILKANGPDFSAGADIQWMKRMAHYTEEENYRDARLLAETMHALHHTPLPTIAMVQGAAFGGGAGLVCACDIAIATHSTRFCFSEVKLGLIPAVISPYVIKAIGERASKCLFMSAETIDAARAYELQLIHHCVVETDLESFALDYAQRIAHWAPHAIKATKSLIHEVANHAIDDSLQHKTAQWIAKIRVSEEAQRGLNAFLNKKPLYWE